RMSWRHVLTAAVLVSALGYFVDVYDLLLFSIVRVPSLTGLGLSGPALLDRGVLLLNVQMAGLLVGGVLWGILGDKRGRRGVLVLLLLVMRVRLAESGLFAALPAHAPKGRLRTLLSDRKAALRWLCLVLVGVPVWYGVGILVTFSPELSVPLKIGGVVNAGL